MLWSIKLLKKSSKITYVYIKVETILNDFYVASTLHDGCEVMSSGTGRLRCGSLLNFSGKEKLKALLCFLNFFHLVYTTNESEFFCNKLVKI